MVCSLFGEHRCCISFCLIYPPPCRHPRQRHHYYYFLRFHRPPTPISFAGADVLPLSSREKFFYNFRIVLSRPSLFFHLCAGRFPRVGLFFHHQACFSSSSLLPSFSLSPFLLLDLCFRFLIFTSFLAQPSILALHSIFLVSSVAPASTFLFLFRRILPGAQF